jgi:fluoroacetyl-CoA thioesterase
MTTDFEQIKPGLTAECETIVDEKLSITFTKTPVLSTPMMISLMEGVCKDLVATLLPEGYITVGYEVHVKHKAAAFIGALIKVWCEILEVAGRKILFNVRATVEDKVIGEGQHRRTIIPYDPR